MRSKIKELAIEANNFARQQIIKGSSQLENNEYEEQTYQALKKSVEDVRKESIVETIKDPYRLEKSSDIYFLNQIIAVYTKYSLGNCMELTLIALDYLIHNAPDVYAEAYYIQGGDHAFVVIGRDPQSTPTNPETWGNNAFICDPWANKIYPASEYSEKLKNYTNQNNTNNVENFNPDRHTLAPLGNYNSLVLHAQDRISLIPDLIATYQKKIQVIIDALTTLKQDLENISKNIEEKYSSSDPKHSVLLDKQNEVQELINSLEIQKAEQFTYDNYDQARTELRQKLKEAVGKFRQCYIFSKQACDALNYHRKVNFLKTKAARFFEIPSTNTLKKTNSAFQKAHQKMQSLYHL